MGGVEIRDSCTIYKRLPIQRCHSIVNDAQASFLKDAPLLSERAQVLLKTLVEKYIDEGQPVGSKSLVKDSGLDVSSATIRNVLSDLENMGLLMSPHTSSGRVPTESGYRLFVDSLVSVKQVKEAELSLIQAQFNERQSTREMALSASGLLSGFTSMASVVMLPRSGGKSLRHIEFLPLSDCRVLVIVVVNECEVENRVIQTRREYTSNELLHISNYLNSQFAGMDIQLVRQNLIKELRDAREEANDFMTSLVSMAETLFPEEEGGDFFVTGKTNLLAYQEIGDTDKLRSLFDVFKGKKDMLEVLDQCLTADGMQVYIGSESGNSVLDECSIITSPYRRDGEVVGVLGVIGPTRMNYEKVIPIVDITAKLFTSALEFK